MSCKCALYQCEINEHGVCGADNDAPCSRVPPNFIPPGEEERIVKIIPDDRRV